MSKKSGKRVRRTHSDEFRRNAVSMVEDQGYTTAQAARELGVNQNLLRTWRKKYGKAAGESSGLSESDQEELDRLQKEVRTPTRALVCRRDRHRRVARPPCTQSPVISKANRPSN